MTLAIILATFIGTAALVGAVAMLFRNDASELAEERLDILTGSRARVGELGEEEASVLISPLDESRSMIDKFLEKAGGFQTFFEQAESPILPSQFVLLTVGMFGGGIFVGTIMHWPVGVGVALGLVLSLLPVMWLFLRRRRRLKQFAQQLPEALELVSRVLRAGHSLAAAISMVAEEMPDPISTEFRKCYEQQNLGVPLEEALEEMSERVPNLDLRFFVTSVVLQRQTGGDLAEILDKIGRLIRERFRIWGQIQALTGEGRLSGIVLLALPPALFLFMFRLNPDYVMMLFEDPLGHRMLAGGIVSQIIGAIVIKKIITIKV